MYIKYKDFFVDIMMTHGVQLQVPGSGSRAGEFPRVVMFCSFGTGFIPCWSYVIIPTSFSNLGRITLHFGLFSWHLFLFAVGTIKAFSSVLFRAEAPFT
jgi:hypothetical protein